MWWIHVTNTLTSNGYSPVENVQEHNEKILFELNDVLLSCFKKHIYFTAIYHDRIILLILRHYIYIIGPVLFYTHKCNYSPNMHVISSCKQRINHDAVQYQIATCTSTQHLRNIYTTTVQYCMQSQCFSIHSPSPILLLGVSTSLQHVFQSLGFVRGQNDCKCQCNLQVYRSFEFWKIKIIIEWYFL